MNTPQVIIDCQALRHNVSLIIEKNSNKKVIVVLKANAYGHGIIICGRALEPLVDFIGVARLSEAILLREAGICKPILLLEGWFIDDDITLLEHYQLQTIIHAKWQIEQLQVTQLNHPISVWLKLDTGMHRLGFRLDEAEKAYQQLSMCPQAVNPIHLMTHFCCADDIQSEMTLQQITHFQHIAEDKMGLKSLSASAGFLAWSNSNEDVIRIGIAQFGVSPFNDKTGADFGLKPVMTLASSVITIRMHKAGECVGYGATWRAEQDTQLAVIAMGYGDGYPRAVPSGTPVFINGQYYPIVGRVSMDMLVVDLGNDHQVKPGDNVILWGAGLPVERIAKASGCSAYELLTRLTSRPTWIAINEITQ